MSTAPAASYGIQQQTIKAAPVGSDGSIYSNAKAISASNADLQNKTKFGGKRGGAATIPVAVVPITYRDPGAGANTTSANVTNSNKTQADLYANKQFDVCVGSSDPTCGQKGGKSRRRRRTCKKRKGRSNKRRSNKRNSNKRNRNKRNSRGKRSK